MPGNKQIEPAVTGKTFKKMMLEKSKTFCMYPWVHLHTTPRGGSAPCCIAESCNVEEGMGSSLDHSLMDLVNSEQMKQLRVDMLYSKENKECSKCYVHEQQGLLSARQCANRDFGYYFDRAIDLTDLDTGEMQTFEMQYFDIRFSNICNFKCRTCGSAYSSQWENEDLKNNVPYARPVPKNNNKEFLQNVIDQIPYMDTAYFAGGEPLITEEHYILLEEMIKQKRTDIKLRYNTNLSNFKFKNKDILSIWKHFKERINIYASIDHYGERAEYIRHGTDWGVVESNFIEAKKQPFITMQINTVVSVFNFLTLREFYQYLFDKKMYQPGDWCYSLYPASDPKHWSAHILPIHLKERGRSKIEGLLQTMKSMNGFTFNQLSQVQSTIPWVFSQHTYEEQKDKFAEEVTRLDKIRGENFFATFPELNGILRPDRRKMAPV